MRLLILVLIIICLRGVAQDGPGSASPRLNFDHLKHLDRAEMLNPGVQVQSLCLGCHEKRDGHYQYPAAKKCLECHSEVQGITAQSPKVNASLSEMFRTKKADLTPEDFAARIRPLFRRNNPKNIHQTKYDVLDCRGCHMNYGTGELNLPRMNVCNQCHCEPDVITPQGRH